MEQGAGSRGHSNPGRHTLNNSTILPLNICFNCQLSIDYCILISNFMKIFVMKFLVPILIITVLSCTSKVNVDVENKTDDTVSIDNTRTDDMPGDTVYKDSIGISPKVYSNERFKDVTVEKTGENTYTISGKGQIFEANFNWVIEDGHEELQKGYTMTDAGAPEWGNFRFSVTAPKKNPNSTLHIIIFESSPKDGSRQYELPILLQ